MASYSKRGDWSDDVGDGLQDLQVQQLFEERHFPFRPTVQTLRLLSMTSRASRDEEEVNFGRFRGNEDPWWRKFNKAQHHCLGMTNDMSFSVARIAEGLKYKAGKVTYDGV